MTAHEHDESWRCVHVDVREVGEVRDSCGYAYAGQGQIMNLSQMSGHEFLLLLLLLLFIGKPQQAFKASLQGARDIS